MSVHPAKSTAAAIQKQVQVSLGHDHVKVKPHGLHFLIQMEIEGVRETVARITPITSRLWFASFRAGSGRWDPLPDEGTLEETAQMVCSVLEPYLTPENY